jgi:hypothetical protein
MSDGQLTVTVAPRVSADLAFAQPHQAKQIPSGTTKWYNDGALAHSVTGSNHTNPCK